MAERIFDASLGGLMLCSGITLLLQTVYGAAGLIATVVGIREEVAFLVN